MFCNKCGKEIADNAIMCPHCGAPTQETNPLDPNVSEKSWLTAFLLCWFFGYLGLHSFYCGKTGIGIAQLLTVGGCGSWSIVDWIMLICGNYKDAEGKVVKRQ